MPIKMVASRRHYVKGEEREYERGEVFEVATDRDARMLEKRKRATRYQEAAPEPTAPKPPRRSRAVEPQPEPASEPAPESASGFYNRRDMRAED